MIQTNIDAFRDRSRLTSIDALRGMASLAVAWFHLTNGNTAFLPAGALKSSGAYGWLGVDVFFVISGFVIPYSLWRGDYRLRDFGRFICKRVARLDPPYFVAIAITLVLAWLSTHMPGYRGGPLVVSWMQVFLHVGYLNVVFGGDSGPYPWLSPVFWTLAVEFQFYMSVGLVYPLLATQRHRWLSMCLAAVCLVLAAVVPSGGVVIHYAPLFLTGIVLFQYRAGAIGTTAAAMVVLVILALATAMLLGPAVALVGMLTAFAIVAFNTGGGVLHRVLAFFGAISYSLYLLHVPIGGRIINLGARYAHSSVARWAVLTLALGVSIVLSWVFARLVEYPAQRFASRLLLNNRVSGRGQPSTYDATAVNPYMTPSAELAP